MKTNEKNEEKVWSISNSKDSILKYYEGLGDGTKKLRGLKTGMTEIDEVISGIDKFVLLAGRSGSGKTQLAIQMALGVIKHEKVPVLFYSLEMSKHEVYTRMVQVCAHMGGYDKTLEHIDIDLNGNNEDLPKNKRKALDDAKKMLWGMADNLYIHDAGDKMPGVLGPREDSKPDSSRNTTQRDKDLWSRNFIKQKVGEIQEMHYGKRPDENDEDEKAACPVLVVIDSFQDIVYGGNNTTDAEKTTAEDLETLIDHTGCTILAISQKNKSGGNGDSYGGILGSVSLIHKPNVVVQLVSAKEMAMTVSQKPAGAGQKKKKDESFEEHKDANLSDVYQRLLEKVKKDKSPLPVYFDVIKSRFTSTGRVKMAIYGAYGYMVFPTAKQLKDDPDFSAPPASSHWSAVNTGPSIAKFYANYDWNFL